MGNSEHPTLSSGDGLSDSQQERLRHIDTTLSRLEEQIQETLKNGLQSGVGMGAGMASLDLHDLTQQRDALRAERSELVGASSAIDHGSASSGRGRLPIFFWCLAALSLVVLLYGLITGPESLGTTLVPAGALGFVVMAGNAIYFSRKRGPNA
ncbi:hypothetical protein [Leifsonia aquatica]|uniref:hypothetical protein n=1 Tax=Leifsonia aquatica TaxID=144185 RepID=UPI003826B395